MPQHTFVVSLQLRFLDVYIILAFEFDTPFSASMQSFQLTLQMQIQFC